MNSALEEVVNVLHNNIVDGVPSHYTLQGIEARLRVLAARDKELNKVIEAVRAADSGIYLDNTHVRSALTDIVLALRAYDRYMGFKAS